MRRSKDFSLFTISDVPYLLPFGQGIADLKRGVQINDTGIFLWELLDRERTETEMLSLYADYYEVSDSQLPQLEADLRQFLHLLEHYGMLERSETVSESDAATHADTVSDTDTALESAAGIHSNAGSDHESSRTNLSPAAVYTHRPIEMTGSVYAAVCHNMVRRYLSIGGLTILLCGPDKAFAQDFDAFEFFPALNTAQPNTDVKASSPSDQTDAAANDIIAPDQTVTVISHAPAQRPEGDVLLKNPELIIMENDLQYTFLFPMAPGICEAHLTKDGADARYYCCPPYTENFRQDLFHAIRLSFLYLAQLHDMVVLHSASLLYRGKAWLFSGHSGAGKSTHTNLWKDLYNIPLINGDLNLLAMENGHPMVHGLPWCGTSGIADTHSYPLGGVLLVKKASQNSAAALDDSHAQLLVAQRLISPSWTESLMQKNLRFVAELAPHILICRLYCTKTPEAAETGRQAVDDYLALLPENAKQL